MLQDLTSIYDGSDLSGATNGVIYLPILRDGTLESADVLTDAAQSGAAVFEVRKNGAVIPGVSALTIANGQKIGTVSELSVEMEKGDEITLNLLSGNVSAPVTLNLSVEDGQAAGGGTLNGDVTGSSGSNQIAKIQGREVDAALGATEYFGDEFDGSTLSPQWTIGENTGSTVVSNGKVRLTTGANANDRELIATQVDMTDASVTVHIQTYPTNSTNNSYFAAILLFPGNVNFVYLLSRQISVVARSFKNGSEIAQVGDAGNSRPQKMRFVHSSTTNEIAAQIWNANTNQFDTLMTVSTVNGGAFDVTQTTVQLCAATDNGVQFADVSRVESTIVLENEESDFLLYYAGGKYQKLELAELKTLLDALP